MADKEEIHTTNYTDTFIEVAEDSTATCGDMPPIKGNNKTIANLQFEMIYEHPYQYSSDEVIFHCYAQKNDISLRDLPEARKAFFSKGQACLRCSPLGKKYGFGIHSNAEGKVALYGVETKEYKQFLKDKSLKTVKAMRSKRAG